MQVCEKPLILPGVGPAYFPRARGPVPGVRLPQEAPAGMQAPRFAGLKVDPTPKAFTLPIINALSAVQLRRQGITQVRVAGDGAERIAALVKSGKHLILAVNHTDETDSYAMFKFSRHVGQRFIYMVGEYLFEGLLAGVFNTLHNTFHLKWFTDANRHKLFGAIGCYPINRYVNDKTAVETTLSVMKAGKHPLVVFPEGMLAWNNRKIGPLEEGLAGFALKTAAKLQADSKKPPEGTPLPPARWFRGHPQGITAPKKDASTMVIVPVGMVYAYAGDIRPNLARCLRRMEGDLKIDGPPETENVSMAALVGRARQVWQAVLDRQERAYCGALSGNGRLLARRREVMTAVLAQAGREIGFTLNPEVSVAATCDAMKSHIYHVDNKEHRVAWLKDVDPKINFALQMQKIDPGEVVPGMRPDRLAEILYVLDSLVNPASVLLAEAGKRTITLHVGQPISMAPWITDKNRPTPEAKTEVTRLLANRMRGLVGDPAYVPESPEVSAADNSGLR